MIVQNKDSSLQEICPTDRSNEEEKAAWNILSSNMHIYPFQPNFSSALAVFLFTNQ
jgi:hypothetical protein